MFQSMLRQRTLMASRFSQRPFLAVVGATGTGKSDLAITLAEQFNGEIINGDALQLYDGLTVTTNKVPVEDRRRVPHHLLGIIGLGEPTWTVGNFTREATRAMESIYARGKLPILVGGTHYYTQSLLFHGQTLDQSATSSNFEAEPGKSPWPILDASGPEMLDTLRNVDPEMAAKWHPSDTRKIRRSLEIYLQTGRKASELYLEQQHRAHVDCTNGHALRNNALIFWTYADGAVLNQRTSARLDRMMQGPLISEIQYMYNYYKERTDRGNDVDKSRGVWVAIGYKEFEAYLDALNQGQSSIVLERVKFDALDKAKIATRRYAKRQVRWIRLKLLPALHAASAQQNFFLLDGSNLETWSRDVAETACSITKRFLSGDTLPDPQIISSTALTILSEQGSQRRSLVRAQHCEDCNITCGTDQSWAQHLKSKKHRKASEQNPTVDH